MSDVFVLPGRGIVTAGPATGGEFRSGSVAQIWHGEQLHGHSTGFVEFHSRPGTVALVLTGDDVNVSPGDRITGARRQL